MLVNTVFILLALSSLIIMSVRFSGYYVALASISSALVCFAIFDSMLATVFLLVVLIPGNIMGYKAKTFCSPLTVLLWGMLPYLLLVAFLVVLYPQLNSQLPLMIGEMQNMLAESAGNLGLSANQQEMMSASIRTTIEWTLRLAPGIFFTVFAAMVLFAYLGATVVSPYFGAILPRMKPLYLWKASEFWLVPLGFSMLAVLLTGQWLRIVGENVLVFMVHLYAFYGICLVDHYFKRMNLTLPIRLVIYLFVLIAVIVAMPTLALLGLIDSRFDFRKISQLEDNSRNIN